MAKYSVKKYENKGKNDKMRGKWKPNLSAKLWIKKKWKKIRANWKKKKNEIVKEKKNDWKVYNKSNEK